MPTLSRQHGRTRRFVLVSLASALCLSGIAYATWSLAPLDRTPSDEFRSGGEFATLEAIDADALEYPEFNRLAYRYSVIPGGAYTPGELRHAIRTDPVVAAHYNDVDQSKLQVRTVAHDQYAYVSYRKGDAVSWTKNKVLLRQGEKVITDGTTLIRAKCGNCISLAPQLPTASDEPDVVEFDRLVEPVAPQQARAEAPPVPLAPAAPVDKPSSGELAVPILPLAAGPLGGVTDPLAAGHLNQPIDETNVPSPSVGSVGPRIPLPPFTPQPPDVLPTPPGLSPPTGGNPPPLVPEDVPPSFALPDGPLPGGPTSTEDPVPVPEAGTLLLVAAGAATLLRRRRSRAR